MASIQLAQVGCGGMGLRHAYGHIELKRKGFDTFDLVAICDKHHTSASHIAQVLEQATGRRPRIYAGFEEMLEKEPSLNAVSITTDTRAHHSLATLALDADKHVSVEKPMGLTVRACLQMMRAAKRAGKVLSVAENFRRDPMNRLVKALLDHGAIGTPRFVMNVRASGGADILQSTGWRHTKLRGGYFLDYGVHDTDLLSYFLGDWDTVYAETHLWEKVRHQTTAPGTLKEFYEHRVEEDAKDGTIVATGEDTLFAVVRYVSSVMGSLSMSWAAHGERTEVNTIYGSQGSLNVPHSRTGQPVLINLSGQARPLTEEEALKLVPQFELDDVTSRFFSGKRRLSSYQMPFAQADSSLIAIEMQDFGDAVLHGREPEVDGNTGLKAMAMCYAVLESGFSQQSVSLTDVVEDRVNAYQSEINDSIGL